MKFRTVLAITLLLTAINGGIAIYWYLLPPPAKTVVDQAPVETTAPEAPKPPEMPPPAETGPSPVILPEKKPPRTPKPPKTQPPANSMADWILVEKKARRLTLFRNNTPIKSYDIALGTGTKASNYTITFTADNNALTINKRTVTLSASKTYDGSAEPERKCGRKYVVDEFWLWYPGKPATYTDAL